MLTSTLTDKGQNTFPQEVREALKGKPRQQLEWTVRANGTAVVQPQPSALHLFGSLRSSKKFPGRAKEREETVRAVAKHAAKKN